MKSPILTAACGFLAFLMPCFAPPVPTFTKITEGPLVEDRLDGWLAFWGDYDSDGRLDVLVAGDVNQWRLYHNDGDLGVIFGRWQMQPERLYINNGDGTFSPWTGQPVRFESDRDVGASETWATLTMTDTWTVYQ